jgi:hypothetical protein
MNRDRRIIVMILIVAALTVATAAYAPYSSTLSKMAQNSASVSPCGAVTPLSAQPATSALASNGAKYPVPSEDVIAQGHSGTSREH